MIKRNFNKSKGQQLVEFAIVVPILLIVIIVIVEFGNAINARVTLAEGAKKALMDVNKLTNLSGNRANKEDFVEAYLKNSMITYFINHNIVNSGSISVNVTSNDDTAVARIGYSYNPIFLPGGIGGVLPTSINFQTSQVLNPGIFQTNSYTSGRSTADLSNLNNIDRGALVDPNYYGFDLRNHIGILLGFYYSVGDPLALDYQFARLVSWEGEDLLPPNLRINLQTGTLETRSPYFQSGVWFNTNIPYIWVVSALGLTHLHYVKYNAFSVLHDDTSDNWKYEFTAAPGLRNLNGGMSWCDGGVVACNEDLRGTAVVNERALRLNPRLGATSTEIWDNDIIYGCFEPIYVPGTPTHYYQHVKGFYYSYSSDYSNYDSRYFITITQPQITGLPNNLYHADFADPALNPFHEIFRFAFKLQADGTLSAGAGTDVDIVDVYIDSDADGIPDAWDNQPELFDHDGNGELDGNDTNIAAGSTKPETTFLHNTAPFGDPLTPIITATPFFIDGTLKTTYTSFNLPEFNPAPLFISDDSEDANGIHEGFLGESIYYETGGGNGTRRFPSWHGSGTELADKSNFIHGTVSGGTIVLDTSDEITFLNANIFSVTNRVTRTPPAGIW